MDKGVLQGIDGVCGSKGFLPVQLFLPVSGFHPEMVLRPGSGV